MGAGPTDGFTRANWSALQWHEFALDQDRLERELGREVAEQIPLLAYSLTERLASCGLRGRVAVHGVAGEAWGIGVSKGNPRRDLPNVVTYPKSLLHEPRPVVNAQLRHTIGRLNHSIDQDMDELCAWCAEVGLDSRLLTPLAEAVQTASADFLEMRNSILDDPAASFAPYYREVLGVEALAGDIGQGLPLKQAVDLTLLWALRDIGLVGDDLWRIALEGAVPEVRRSFSPALRAVVSRAVRTSSGRVKLGIVRDELWPALSHLVGADDLDPGCPGAVSWASSLPEVAGDDGDGPADEVGAEEGGASAPADGTAASELRSGEDGSGEGTGAGLAEDDSDGTGAASDSPGRMGSGPDALVDTGMASEGPDDDVSCEGADERARGLGGIGDARTDIEDLLGQLGDIQGRLESSFGRPGDGSGLEVFEVEGEDAGTHAVRAAEGLDAVKARQRLQVERMYRETSGLSGGALERYVDLSEETHGMTDDLVEFFTRRFELDVEYAYEKDQLHGTRLQKGWTAKLLGTRHGMPVVDPSVFERKLIPKTPQFVWSVIIDNSLSCSGPTLDEEVKAVVALERAASALGIPLEIVTFGGEEGYVFLKTFDQELRGRELANLVRLQADQLTPDVETLNAACTSLLEYVDRFDHSYNFVYFMTDGWSGEGSIMRVINAYRRHMSITGIGLAMAARHIADTWGRSSVAVEDVGRLSDALIARIEGQVEEMLD